MSSWLRWHEHDVKRVVKLALGVRQPSLLMEVHNMLFLKKKKKIMYMFHSLHPSQFSDYSIDTSLYDYMSMKFMFRIFLVAWKFWLTASDRVKVKLWKNDTPLPWRTLDLCGSCMKGALSLGHRLCVCVRVFTLCAIWIAKGYDVKCWVRISPHPNEIS